MSNTDIETGCPPGYRILLVEDDALLATVASDQLEALGCCVAHVSASAEDAIHWIDAGGAVDLVLSDIVMAGMNGVALAVYLGEHHPQVRVLLTTGYAEASLERTGIERPEFDILNKPYRRAELIRRVRAAIDAPSRS